MLYGGPLGTYLSGLSPGSSAVSGTANSSGAGSGGPVYTSSYQSAKPRRTSSRYRSGLPSSGRPVSSSGTQSGGIGSGGTGLSSSYFTPQLRRKYDQPEVEPAKHTRFVPWTQSRVSTSPSGPSNAPAGTAYATATGQPMHYSRWSPNHSAQTSSSTRTGTLGTSSSWNSDLSSAASGHGSLDYKRLYEAERLTTDELRTELAHAHKEMRGIQTDIEHARKSKRVGNSVEQRKIERRISECEEELKLLEKLRAESDKLRAEHRALVRVVSRLNREQ